LHFFIGSNEDYRTHPQEVTVKMSLDGRLAALDRIMKERRPDSSEDPSTLLLQTPPTVVTQATHQVSHEAVNREDKKPTKNKRYDPRIRPVKTTSHLCITNPDIKQPRDGPRTAVARPSAGRRNTAPSV
jgi:hypothetical protein